jgi:UDPglucose 6-dehydrogenase
MKISVIGLGKLGSPLSAVLASKGHFVIGVDLNPEFVNKINNGIAPVPEPCLQELISTHRSRLKATMDYEEAILGSDVTFVIVPTPSEKDGLFSNKYLLKAIEQIGKALTKKSSYHLVVITSTVIPGSTDGEIKEVLEISSDRTVGADLGLCYNPEFIALGSVVRNMLYPDMILIGESDQKAGDLLEEICRLSCENSPPVRRMNLVNAEITKISVNTFVTTKISYANMLSDICQRLLGGDVAVVTDALGLDSRIGPKYLNAGVAFGGPCFPRDNMALSAFGRKIGARCDLAEATQSINRYQNERMIELVEKHAKSKKVSILGLSYKPGTYVVEESQGIQLANYLTQNGYDVFVYDPMALDEARKNLHPDIAILSSVQDCLQQSDTILVMVPWPEFSDEITPNSLQKENSHKVILDCWRLFSREEFENRCELVYLGYSKTSDLKLKEMTCG